MSRSARAAMNPDRLASSGSLPSSREVASNQAIRCSNPIWRSDIEVRSSGNLWGRPRGRAGATPAPSAGGPAICSRVTCAPGVTVGHPGPKCRRDVFIAVLHSPCN
jgi:hypothetical protein